MGFADKLRAQETRTGSVGPAIKKDLDAPPKAPVRRDELGRVLPGQSLNPTGRPRGASAIAKQILEREGSQAWEFLRDIADGLEDVAPALRVEVILRLQDRAYGKAANVNLNGDLEKDQVANVIDVEVLAPGKTLELQAHVRGLALLDAARIEQNQQDASFEPVLPPRDGGLNTEGK